VLEAGADSFVHLEPSGWEERIGQVDLAYDTIGGDILERSLAIVKPGGTLVTVMFPPQRTRSDIRVVHFIREPNGSQLAEISRMVDAGQVRPHVGAVYSLADTKTAFAAQARRDVTGKVILQLQ
jgi:NADPH:quinone reductase-like Zn-dependent oxidoreductase